jgi:putative endopeptidase
MRWSWSRINALLLALVIAIVAGSPLTAIVSAEEIGSHGVNSADMDFTVDPGVDFYRYANGGWLDRTTIPPDFASIETMSDLDGRTRRQLVDLLVKSAARGTARVGSDEWKAIRLFEQGTDLTTRNAQGIAPIQPILNELDAIDDLSDLHRVLETSVFQSMPGLFFVSAGPDLANSAETVAYLNGPSLGLGIRDYYLEDDAATNAARDAYIATAADLLTFVDGDAAAAQSAARAVYDFEATLAELTLTREESMNYSLVNNPTSLEELTAMYPLLDWPRYLDALGLESTAELIVLEPRYMRKLDAIVRQTPLPVLKQFLTLQLLWSSSANLSEAMETTSFGFYGTALSGLKVQAPIEGRTLDQVSHFLGDAVGTLYVDAYFPPEAKARSTELVQEIVEAYRSRLENNDWMAAETKSSALAKLAKLRVKVGYPDHWRAYDEVEITDSYFGSALSAFNVWYRESLAKIGSPVDKDAWPFPPQTVNAMYNPLNNEIIIPAGILQPPFFDAEADPASNFGAIGFVIGHEITHGFDVQGSQFDGDGNLANWWTGADHARFESLNDQLVDQYGRIEVAAGVTVDGHMTLAENVADLGGIQVAFGALQLHLDRHRQPISDTETMSGLTQEQRFFVAAATVWRAEIRDEALMTQLLSDPHAPAAVRATQPLRNCDAFYAAFSIGPDDPMYLSPAERIIIW